MVELKVKLSSKGQVLIPKILRDEFKLVPGNDVIVGEGEQGIIVRSALSDPANQFLEIAKNFGHKKLRILPDVIGGEYEEKWLRSKK